jgi:hypothetical protein
MQASAEAWNVRDIALLAIALGSTAALLVQLGGRYRRREKAGDYARDDGSTPDGPGSRGTQDRAP